MSYSCNLYYIGHDLSGHLIHDFDAPYPTYILGPFLKQNLHVCLSFFFFLGAQKFFWWLLNNLIIVFTWRVRKFKYVFRNVINMYMYIYIPCMLIYVHLLERKKLGGLFGWMVGRVLLSCVTYCSSQKDFSVLWYFRYQKEYVHVHAISWIPNNLYRKYTIRQGNMGAHVCL